MVRLHGLAERQFRIVGEGDLGPLLGLLAAKQQVLNDLQAVESALSVSRAGSGKPTLAVARRAGASSQSGGAVRGGAARHHAAGGS